MNQFKIIFLFELKGYFKNKVFLGVTFFFVCLITVLMFMPRIISAVKHADDYSSATESENQKTDGLLLLSAGEIEYREQLLQAFQESFTEYEVVLTDDAIDRIKKQVSSKKAECAFILDSPTSYRYYVENLAMQDTKPEIADEILKNAYAIQAMASSGITEKAAESILSVEIGHTVESFGKDQLHTFFYTYIMVFALYMMVLLYGQMVAANVASEKSSRAMELLITSAKPTSMMFGKVLSSCLAGFIQLTAIFGSYYVMYHINLSYWKENMAIASAFDMPASLFLYMLIFFVLGFVIYAFMFGAVGSTVSKLEDINTAVMPVTLLFVTGFMVVIFSMTNGTVDNIWMKACSYVPFTSPMAMFTRIAMSTVPFYEIVISIGILILSAAIIGFFSAKIYRAGVLLYGTKRKISSILKAIKTA